MNEERKKIRRLAIELPNGLYGRLKQEAARRAIETGQSISMADIVRKALMVELKKMEVL